MNDPNRTEKKRGTTLFILFMAILIAGALFSLTHIRGIVTKGGGQILSALRGESTVSSIPGEFESYYDSLYSGQSWTLDAFSLTQRALGKHETRNFEVLKAKNGELYLGGIAEGPDEESLGIMADQCELLYEETEKNGGNFLYVQAPFKNVGQAPELSDYSQDVTEESESRLDDLIRDKGIPVLDLREYSECTDYYKTDHHWTVGAAFNAARLIADEIHSLYGIGCEGYEEYGDLNNYKPVTYVESFLGSIGIKVGPYFGGKDSYTVYDPKFETDLTFRSYMNGELQFEYSGEFWETFIDQEKLEDKTYNNKYDANLHGAYVESIIYNHLAESDCKCLLVAHSYGRPLAQYMSLGFSELRYLDPQKGRYNEDLLEYIREYQPDVVIYMYNDIVNVGDGNWTE